MNAYIGDLIDNFFSLGACEVDVGALDHDRARGLRKFLGVCRYLHGVCAGEFAAAFEIEHCGAVVGTEIGDHTVIFHADIGGCR